jgi:hypothetical protein
MLRGDGDSRPSRTGSAHSQNIHEREQIDIIAGSTVLARHGRAMRPIHFGAHKQIKAVMDVVWRQAVFALRFRACIS